MKKDLKILREVSLSGGKVILRVLKNIKNSKTLIHRFSSRGKVSNYIENYEFIDAENNSELRQLDEEFANKIMDRAESGNPYSSIFIFYDEDPTSETVEERDRSKEEHKYTSTGIKFWRHKEQMLSYKKVQLIKLLNL